MSKTILIYFSTQMIIYSTLHKTTNIFHWFQLIETSIKIGDISLIIIKRGRKKSRDVTIASQHLAGARFPNKSCYGAYDSIFEIFNVVFLFLFVAGNKFPIFQPVSRYFWMIIFFYLILFFTCVILFCRYFFYYYNWNTLLIFTYCLPLLLNYNFNYTFTEEGTIC